MEWSYTSIFLERRHMSADATPTWSAHDAGLVEGVRPQTLVKTSRSGSRELSGSATGAESADGGNVGS